MQRLHLQPWCAQSSSRLVGCGGWMWLSFVIYIETLPDAWRWGIVSYFNAIINKYGYAVCGSCCAYVCTICVYAFTAEFMMQSSFWVTMLPAAFHLALSDYIAVREEWRHRQSGDLHDSEYILTLLFVLFLFFGRITANNMQVPGLAKILTLS